MPRGYSTLRIADAEARTPPSGVGEWSQALREAAFDAISESDMTDVMKALVAKAKSGDLPAIKLLMNYVAPAQPAPRVQQVVMVQQNAPDAPPAATGFIAPPAPTVALPKSDAKIDAMAGRAARGQPLFADGDATHESEPTEAELDAMIAEQLPTMPNRRGDPL